jgi:dihydropteroate synthase
MSDLMVSSPLIAPRPLFSVPLRDGRTLELGARTLVMGVVNVTPDSFSDGGARLDPDVATADAIRMAEQGADIVDIGGESTRPGAPSVDAAEEWRRLEPVLAGLRGRLAVPISVDTYKAEVAARALELGATIVNDVSGLTFDPDLAAVVAARGAAVILMHTRGRSARMYERAEYADVVGEVRRELDDRDRAAREAGVAPDRIILDPGIGFAKRAEQSLATIAGLPHLASLGRPMLVGPSRKSFLDAALGPGRPADRVWGTAAAVTAAVLWGAHIVRVHDVAAMRDVARVADALRASA